MRLEIWSILIIVIGFQGLFLLMVLLSSKEKRYKRGTSYLILIILALNWFLLEFFAIRNKIDIRLNILYGTRYGSWFLLGPLTYFYFKSITVASWKITKRDVFHFVPFLIFTIIIPYISYKTLNNSQIDYGMLSTFDHRERDMSFVQYMYSLIFIFQFVHLGYFLIQNLKLIRTYSRNLNTEYSTVDSKIKWLRYFNISLILLLLFSAVFLYVLLVTDIYRRHLDYIYVVPIGLLFYFISFRFMRAEWRPTNKNMNKYSGSSLNKEHIPKYLKKLNGLMDNEKLYLKNDLRLNELAEEMDMKTHHLSQLINETFNISFFDFVNKHRISEAKQIISNNPQFTLLQVTFDSGFNNKTSFVNAFKKFENKTPSTFRKEVISQ